MKEDAEGRGGCRPDTYRLENQQYINKEIDEKVNEGDHYNDNGNVREAVVLHLRK